MWGAARRIVLGITVLLSVLVLGIEQTENSTFPAFALAKTINLGNFFQRVEGILITLWILTFYQDLSLVSFDSSRHEDRVRTKGTKPVNLSIVRAVCDRGLEYIHQHHLCCRYHSERVVKLCAPPFAGDSHRTLSDWLNQNKIIKLK